MDNVKLLSGKNLMENSGHKPGCFLPVRGPKQSLPSGSWLQQKQLESSLQDIRAVLQDQRIEKKGSTSQASWLKDIQKAVVTENHGSAALHIGHSERGCTYIHPEEALYLLEMSSLELKYGGVAVSIQQAYSLLLGKSVSMDRYKVYTLLSKQGYKLIRYDSNREYIKQYTNSDNDNKQKEENSIGEVCSENLTGSKKPDSPTKPVEESVSEAINVQVDVEEVAGSLRNEELEDGSNSIVDVDSCKSGNNVEKEAAVVDEMLVDSSSDDCMVVSESQSNDKSHSDRKRKSGGDDSVPVQSKMCKLSDDRNGNGIKVYSDRDAITVDGVLNRPSKAKIFSSIVNCYRLKIVYVMTPKPKYVPPNINLTRISYIVNIDSLSNKNNTNESEYQNNDYNSQHGNRRDPRYSSINYCGRMQNDRFLNGCSNRQRDPSYRVTPNSFSNNTSFFNHIFHQLSMKQFNCYAQMDYRQFDNNSFFGNMHFVENNHGGSYSSVSRQNVPRNSGAERSRQNQPTRDPKRFAGRVNPFARLPDNYQRDRRRSLERKRQDSDEHREVEEFRRRVYSSRHTRNKRRRRWNDTGDRDNARRDDSTSDSDYDDVVEDKRDADLALHQIMELSDRYQLLSERRDMDNFRDALESIVKKYNFKYDKKLVLNLDAPKKRLDIMNLNLPGASVAHKKEGGKVVQLSSDSDCQPLHESNNSRASENKTCKDNSLLFTVDNNSINSSDERDVSDEDRRIEDNHLENTTADEISNNVATTSDAGVNNDNGCLDNDPNAIFGSWLPSKDSWNGPLRLPKKSKRNRVSGLSYVLSSAFLNSVKNLSYEPDCSVENWGQIKQVYEKNNVLQTVAISDEEPATPVDLGESVVTVKIEDTEPLVRPQDCTSIRSVLSRLEIIQSYQPNVDSVQVEGTLKILYEVHLPSTPFKRSMPPTPAYFLAILRHDSPRPSDRQLEKLRQSLPDGAPLLLAIISQDSSICFIRMEQVHLPTLL